MPIESPAGFSPRMFGKYLLLERIGRGGMAEVFRAKTFGPAGFVKESAIKKILNSLLDDEQFLQMFVDEARLTAVLTHPNIVQVLELGDIDGHLFISMEYVPGKDLLDVLARSARRGIRIPVDVVLYIAMGLLRGLGFAHDATDDLGNAIQIVHRDVSPSNVLLSYDGLVKVGDFGIAKSGMQRSKTEIGTQKGKTGYMSPEQVTGDDIDPRSDLFAATTILFEMLTMSRLFKAANDLDVMLKIRDTTIEADLARAVDLPEGLDAVLRKGLAQIPEDRFQSAHEFVEALENVCERNEIFPRQSALKKYLTALFSDKISEEAEIRKLDPPSDEGFDSYVQLPTARYRYKDPSGMIHGPMSAEMLEEMLNSRSASAAERVSIDAGAWEALGESAMLANVMRPVATSTSEQLIMPEDDDDDEDPAHLDPHDLRMQRPGTDWEELSLAGINPRARKNRRDSAADRSPKVAGPYKPPHVKRETSDNLIAQHATRHKRESVSSGDVLVKTAPRRVKIITPPAVAVTPSKPRPHQPLVSATEASNLRALEATDAGQADMEGAIADISILRIIHRLLLGKCSGRLRLSGEDATRDIYLRDGRVVAIDSTVPEDQLGRILVAQGLVTNEQLNFALDRAQTTRKLLGAVVVAERLCAPHELFHTLQEQLRVKLTRSLFWQNVIWEWW
ncbi:MAG: serine/threonine protein kinase, partial [Bradymonadia bacterium]